MAGVAGRSGGHNRLSAAEHLLRGTFRADRHGARSERRSPVPTSLADRRRVLRGLTPEARRIAIRLLDHFGDWDEGALQVVRAYALSCVRLDALQTAEAPDAVAIHRETRCNLHLLKSLDLDR